MRRTHHGSNEVHCAKMVDWLGVIIVNVRAIH